MNLSYQKRVASKLLKCGVHRVWVDDRPEVQERISEGGSLSLDDLGALLKHGKGIQDLEKSIPKPKNSEKKTKTIPRKRVQTSRGRRRAGPRDSALKNDR